MQPFGCLSMAGPPLGAIDSSKAPETTDTALKPLTLSSAGTPPVIVEASSGFWTIQITTGARSSPVQGGRQWFQRRVSECQGPSSCFTRCRQASLVVNPGLPTLAG